MSLLLSQSYRWKPRIGTWPTTGALYFTHSAIWKTHNRYASICTTVHPQFRPMHNLRHDRRSRWNQLANEQDLPLQSPKNHALARGETAGALDDPSAFIGFLGGGISENTHCVGSLGVAVSSQTRHR